MSPSQWCTRVNVKGTILTDAEVIGGEFPKEYFDEVVEKNSNGS